MSGPPRVCRFCRTPLCHSFVDLGMSPLANSFLRADELETMEPFYPLHAYFCEQCFLVQVGEFRAPADLFTDYAYFSSYSDTWLQHCQQYATMMAARLGLGAHSSVIEVASNDGYLLQYFQRQGIPVLGIEPAANVAAVAQAMGIPTLVQFLGVGAARGLVAAGHQADLLVGNNVLAHVPDLNDFVGGLRLLLKPAGVLTMEFPHLLRMMVENQFDTIYHEHFSYWSLLAVENVLAANDMTVFDVEELTTHGGSLRIYARPTGAGDSVEPRVVELRNRERTAGLHRAATYATFSDQVRETKRQLLEFLIAARRAGKRIAAYGAAAKGNTLLNYCGVRSDFIDYTVDRSPHKQGRFLPGTHIPIFAPERIAETKPDYLLILPWNLKDEIIAQMSYVREWGCRFVVPIPRVKVIA